METIFVFKVSIAIFAPNYETKDNKQSHRSVSQFGIQKRYDG
jgi:hypothetical protein